ncbi:MAG: hypothetical protein J6U54_12695 [Clostridiales bacterium]|nr:hypothetical protein [Clostridiales bacterium]
MLKDRSQCRGCVFAQWGYKSSGSIKTFIWCNHLDKTGECHVVKDGVCQSKKTKDDFSEEELEKMRRKKSIDLND